MLKNWRVAAGLVLGLLLAVFTLWTIPSNNSDSFVEINDIHIKVQVASTIEEQAQGLSGRDSLAEDEGLLFIYDHPGFQRFWMKDMNFPIDIIWISADKLVVDITENLTPDTYPQTYSSIEPAQYVLEVNAGYAHENGIKKGSKALISLDETTLIN